MCWKSSKSGEAKSSEVNVKSEVKSLKWSEKFSNIKCSEVKWSEVKWTKQSEVEWGEVKCSIGNGKGERIFMEKVYRVVSDEKWRTGVKAWVD